ncbi:MAG: T9SS type A sorting domain-containing protein [Bacteroidota bacterium]
MKKLIFTALSALVSGGLFAQTFSTPAEPKFQYSPVQKPQATRLNKTNISDWYNHLDFIAKSNVSASLTGSWAFSYGDTLPKLLFSTGEPSNPTWMGFGQVLDPKDDLIDLTDNPGIKLSKYVSYRVDSLRFTYCYVRNVDSIDDGMGGKMLLTDTMFVYQYKGSQISKNSFTGSGNKLALVGWNTGTRKGNNYYKVDTILLNANTGTGLSLSDNNIPEGKVTSKLLSLPTDSTTFKVNANKGLEANNLVGALIVFKSGQASTYNGNQDTLVLLNQKTDPLPPGTRRGNFLMFFTQRNEGVDNFANPTFYNTSQLPVKWAAYGQNAGWANGMVSGNAFVQEAFVDFDFLLSTTSDNVGISELKNDVFAASSVYPNPANSTDKILVAFNLKTDATVNVSIVNLMGQEVKKMDSKNYPSGSSVAEFDLAGMKAGVYMVNMTVNGVSQAKKLIITE